MKTFFNILQTLVNVKTKHYPDEQPFKILNNDVNSQHIIFLINSIFYKASECTTKTLFSKNAYAKFTSLCSILENSFYKNELKESIFTTFTRAQKYYYAFSRLAHYYKIKKHKYVVTDDLMMNKLDIASKTTFILVEDKYNYLFNINEIITIIETAIGNTHNFFSEPLTPSNPYNNKEFSISTLYNVYFQMKQNQCVIPLLFHCFFLENFNKDLFVEQHEPIIRENAIKKYVFNSPYTTLYSSVIYMLQRNKYTVKLSIDKNFPRNVLVDIFRPFLFHYYIIHYYIKNTSKIYNSKRLLDIKLKKFYEYNPLFGRETIKITKDKNNKIVNREYIINQNHISFYNIDVSLSNNLEPINDNVFYIIGYHSNNIITNPSLNVNTIVTPITSPNINEREEYYDDDDYDFDL